MMITTLFTLHDTDEDHLGEVIETMRELGAPTIRVVHCGDHYVAIEGCHRLAAAAELGLAPDLVVLGQDEIVERESLDFDGLDEERCMAGELVGKIFDPLFSTATIYTICEDGTISA